MCFRMSAEVVRNAPVWCFAKLGETTYAGTGPDGDVICSVGGRSWSTFMRVGDCHVRSLVAWANCLFAGTEPSGRIYVHNFSTGKEYCMVQTEDHAVTCFAEHGGMLYAGTSPRGVVYSFDGRVWRAELKNAGQGITAMVSDGGVLHVCVRSVESPIMLSNGSWSLSTTTSRPQRGTVASSRSMASGGVDASAIIDLDEEVSSGRLSRSAAEMAIPTAPETSLTAACVHEGTTFVGGATGRVMSCDSGFHTVHAADDGPVVSVVSAGVDGLVVAHEGVVYLVDIEGVEQRSSESSRSSGQ